MSKTLREIHMQVTKFLRALPVLDAVADKVLAYRPKPKSLVGKKRRGKKRKLKSRDSNQ